MSQPRLARLPSLGNRPTQPNNNAFDAQNSALPTAPQNPAAQAADTIGTVAATYPTLPTNNSSNSPAHSRPHNPTSPANPSDNLSDMRQQLQQLVRLQQAANPSSTSTLPQQGSQHKTPPPAAPHSLHSMPSVDTLVQSAGAHQTPQAHYPAQHQLYQAQLASASQQAPRPQYPTQMHPPGKPSNLHPMQPTLQPPNHPNVQHQPPSSLQPSNQLSGQHQPHISSSNSNPVSSPGHPDSHQPFNFDQPSTPTSRPINQPAASSPAGTGNPAYPNSPGGPSPWSLGLQQRRTSREPVQDPYLPSLQMVQMGETPSASTTAPIEAAAAAASTAAGATASTAAAARAAGLDSVVASRSAGAPTGMLSSTTAAAGVGAAQDAATAAAALPMPALRAVRTSAALSNEASPGGTVLHNNPAFKPDPAFIPDYAGSPHEPPESGAGSPGPRTMQTDALSSSLPGSPDLGGTAGHLYMYNEETGLLVNTGKGTGDLAVRERKQFVETRSTGKFVRVWEHKSKWSLFQSTERRRQAWPQVRHSQTHHRPTLEVFLTGLCDTFSMIGMFCQGVLGGLAFLTLFMVYLRVPIISSVDSLGDFLMYYAPLAQPLNRTYYALITISMIAACSRHAAAQERQFEPSNLKLRKLGWGSMLAYMVAYICCIVCTPLDDELTYNWRRVPNFWRLGPFNSTFKSQLRSWHTLNFIRVLACIAGWLLLCYQMRPGGLQCVAEHIAQTKLEEQQHQEQQQLQQQQQPGSPFGLQPGAPSLTSSPFAADAGTSPRMVPPSPDTTMLRSGGVTSWMNGLKSVPSTVRDQDGSPNTKILAARAGTSRVS